MDFYYRKAEDRGSAEHGWLHARFTFSFADYYEPEHCGFHSLIVMNNDVIEPKSGFGRHPHEDAEIFTYVISGQLQHKDSMGNGSIIHAGNLQYMSAGDGIFHSEYNPSDNEKVELYQIWMLPNQKGGKPIYEEKQLDPVSVNNRVRVLFSGDGREKSTIIRQNAVFGYGQIDSGNQLEIEPDEKLPNLWIQIISGSCKIDSFSLNKADGLAVENVDKNILLSADKSCEFFIFQLPNDS